MASGADRRSFPQKVLNRWRVSAFGALAILAALLPVPATAGIDEARNYHPFSGNLNSRWGFQTPLAATGFTAAYLADTITFNQWQRLALVCDNNGIGGSLTLTAYRNGVLIGSVGALEFDGRFSLSSQVLRFADNNSETTPCRVNALCFWTEPRSAAEIAAMAGPSAANPEIQWPSMPTPAARPGLSGRFRFGDFALDLPDSGFLLGNGTLTLSSAAIVPGHPSYSLNGNHAFRLSANGDLANTGGTTFLTGSAAVRVVNVLINPGGVTLTSTGATASAYSVRLPVGLAVGRPPDPANPSRMPRRFRDTAQLGAKNLATGLIPSGGASRIRDLGSALQADSFLYEGLSSQIETARDSAESGCGILAGNKSFSFTPPDHRVLTRDGGLHAQVTLNGTAAQRSVEWGAIDASTFAHKIDTAFSSGSVLIAGTSLSASQVPGIPLADRPAALLLSGNGNGSLPETTVERPSSPAYLTGAADYPGLNLPAPASLSNLVVQNLRFGPRGEFLDADFQAAGDSPSATGAARSPRTPSASPNPTHPARSRRPPSSSSVPP